MTTLADFAEHLDLVPDALTLGGHLLALSRRILRPSVAALLLVDEATGEFVVSHTSPTRAKRRWKSELDAQVAAGAFGWAINQRHPVMIPVREGTALAGARTLVVAPLVVRYRLLGALLAATTRPAEDLPHALPRQVMVLAKQFALTLDMDQLASEHHEQAHLLARTRAALSASMNELASVQAALQQTMAEYARKTEELNQLQSHLEAIVDARTSELRQMNQRLALLSQTDPLTGLLNRRSFEQRLIEEEQRRQRTGRPVTVAIIDMNGLKDINDGQGGHAAGDAALVATATVLRAVARATDVVARIGGDEFALLLTETGELGASQFRERLQRAGAEMYWCVDRPPGLSFAVGTASTPPATSLQHALMLADERMYADKRAHYARRRAVPVSTPA